jgi:transposase InsO family protein
VSAYIEEHRDRFGVEPKLELAVVEYVAWFNNDRLHESLGDVSPAECEALHVAQGVQLSNPS